MSTTTHAGGGGTARFDPAPSPMRPAWEAIRPAAGGLLLAIVAALVVGALLPFLAPVDRWLFDAVNDAGYGSGVVYDALDPHDRNYRLMWLTGIVAGLVMGGPWRALGVAAAVLLAGLVSYAALEIVVIAVQRPRPELAVDGVLLAEGRSWAELSSYPSGHVAVTAGIAAAVALTAPALRWPMLVYTLLIVWSRIAFGAHYPLDTLAGLAIGAAGGWCSVRLVQAMEMLPGPSAVSRQTRRRS